MSERVIGQHGRATSQPSTPPFSLQCLFFPGIHKQSYRAMSTSNCLICLTHLVLYSRSPSGHISTIDIDPQQGCIEIQRLRPDRR